MNAKSLTIAAAALLMSGMAVAQTPPERARGMADSNGDGAISRAEMESAATARFARMDANGDGRIDRADREARRTQRQAQMFERLDSDRNGAISRSEWDAAQAARAQRMSERQARGGEGRERMAYMRGRRDGGRMAMAMRADSNGDRAISREEFLAAAAARHSAMDGNRDGTVTAAERQAHRAQRGTQR